MGIFYLCQYDDICLFFHDKLSDCILFIFCLKKNKICFNSTLIKEQNPAKRNNDFIVEKGFSGILSE